MLNFSIANHNGSNRLEVDAIYELKIVTTTNLPLTYKLYKNEDYNDANATNLLEGTMDLPVQDEDGTYFRTITTDKITLKYTEGKTNLYQKVVYFPENYNQENYQDIIELIEINVNGKQVTGE